MVLVLREGCSNSAYAMYASKEITIYSFFVLYLGNKHITHFQHLKNSEVSRNFRRDGDAFSGFRKIRIGFCVHHTFHLHPLHPHVHAHMHTHVHAIVHAHMYPCALAHPMHMCTCTCTQAHMHMLMCTSCTHACTCTCMHAHVHRPHAAPHLALH